MKPSALAIAGSFAANVTLFTVLALRPTLAPPAFRDFFTFGAAAPEITPSASRHAPSGSGSTPHRAWAAIQSDDLTTLVSRLRAAGFPPGVIREIIRSEVNARYNPRIAALREPDPNTPFWKISPFSNNTNPKLTEEITQLQRERSTLLRDLFRDPFFGTGDATAAQRNRFGNLSPAKIDQLQRVEEDYAEMTAQIRAGMKGITLPEDREKLALLEREKRTDLAAILTPEEFNDYQMRTSPITSMLRSRLGSFEPTEGEFRAIFQAQQAFSDQFPGGGTQSVSQEQRTAAQAQLNQQMKAGLGEARYADFTRETSREFQQLSRLAQRENLRPETAVQAYNVRDLVAQESNRIYSDPALSFDAKKAALQSLAQNTRGQLLSTLGPAAGPAYVKIADQWLTNVEHGAAVSFGGSPGGLSTTSNGSSTATVSINNDTPTYRRLPNPPPPRK